MQPAPAPAPPPHPPSPPQRHCLVPSIAFAIPLAEDLSALPRILFWSAAVIGLCVALFFIVSVVRKRLTDVPTSEGPATGFTLADLRQLHNAGQMSDEEFERAKAKIVTAGKQMA